MTDTLLSETFERILTDCCPADVVRAAEAGKVPDALLSAIHDAGVEWLGQPEERGGSGGTIADAAALVRVIGRHAAPVSLPDQLLVGGWLLTSAGLPLQSGSLSVAPGRPEDTVVARKVGGGWQVTGTMHRVPWGSRADNLATVILGDQPVAAVIPATAFEVRPGSNLAGEPRDDVTVDAFLGPDRVAAVEERLAAELTARGALTRVILIASCLERVLEMTVAYAGTRVQFGRPISRFQAVAQNLALLAEDVLQARMASELAVEALTGGDVAREAGAVKTVAGSAAGAGSRRSHQVHGAIGTTAEYDLQLYTRRLLAWRDEFGSERVWATELGRTLLSVGADGAWDLCTGASATSLHAHP